MKIQNLTKTFILIVALITAYGIGFGHGQSSAYSKMTDDKSLSDIYFGGDDLD